MLATSWLQFCSSGLKTLLFCQTIAAQQERKHLSKSGWSQLDFVELRVCYLNKTSTTVLFCHAFTHLSVFVLVSVCTATVCAYVCE